MPNKQNIPRSGKLPDSFEKIDEQLQRLSIHKAKLYEKLVESDNPNDIIKAINYQKKMTGGSEASQRAYLFAPENEFYNGLGFKGAPKMVPFEMLRSMGSTPMINSVISTRLNQILEFGSFSVDMDRPGWTIRKKLSRFKRAEGDYKNTDNDKRRIEEIGDFLENGGLNAKFTLHDDFYDFLKIFPKDLLELDQGVFEVERTRSGELLTYGTVDAATIRLLETIDPHYKEQDKYEKLRFKGQEYYPYYCQVWRERTLNDPKTKEPIIWYPWEMCFGIRNKSSNILRNGYGESELEVLLRIVTWTLESMEYNGRFFTNGSNPRGFFTIKGGVDPRVLNDFRNAWRSMVTGWQNSHKIPMFEAEKIDWVDMQQTNREMEFQKWLEFLTLITCAVYKIDPSEMGFKFQQQTSLFEGGRGQKDRLDHSKDKGLKPLLKVIQKSINKYIVSELDEGYEFAWTGVDIEDETLKLDNDIKKVANGGISMEDMFRQYSGREFDPKKDTILNSVYQQSKQMSMYGGQGMNDMVDQEMGGEDFGTKNPFDDFTEGMTKGKSSDPIMSEVVRYINQEFGGKKDD